MGHGRLVVRDGPRQYRLRAERLRHVLVVRGRGLRAGSSGELALRDAACGSLLGACTVERLGHRRADFFGGAAWVSELTASVEVKPSSSLAGFAEYRHDQAESPSYFRGSVVGLGTPLAPFIANSKTQDTVLVGATAWF